MADLNITHCLELLQVSLQLLQREEDFEMIISNLNFVCNIILEVLPELQHVLPMVDRAITYVESVADSEPQNTAVGRPRILVPTRSLEFLLSLNFKVSTMAQILGVCKKTVHRRLKESNLSIAQSYSRIDDDGLDLVVTNIVLHHPNTGYKRMKGFLLETGIKVTNQRVLDALRRVDPVGVAQRRSQNRAIYRRTYFVQYAMELWHIDTHHKLIRYGIVVRGGIDGKSRTIVYLDVGANNTARSSFDSFMEGVRQYGVPFRTRTDKGGENVDIARYMLETRGTGRGSHICGRSVHNQRIERLWRDVHYGCLSFYKCAFVQLEDLGYFNIDNLLHVAVLQMVFIPRIKQSLDQFTAAWNRHSLSSEHGRTPLQLMLLHLPPSSMDIVDPPAPVNYDDEEFFVSNDGDLEQFHIDRVQVEDFQAILSNSQLELLNTLDMLRRSDYFGADIYVDAITLLSRQ